MSAACRPTEDVRTLLRVANSADSAEAPKTDLERASHLQRVDNALKRKRHKKEQVRARKVTAKKAKRHANAMATEEKRHVEAMATEEKRHADFARSKAERPESESESENDRDSETDSYDTADTMDDGSDTDSQDLTIAVNGGGGGSSNSSSISSSISSSRVRVQPAVVVVAATALPNLSNAEIVKILHEWLLNEPKASFMEPSIETGESIRFQRIPAIEKTSLIYGDPQSSKTPELSFQVWEQAVVYELTPMVWVKNIGGRGQVQSFIASQISLNTRILEFLQKMTDDGEMQPLAPDRLQHFILNMNSYVNDSSFDPINHFKNHEYRTRPGFNVMLIILANHAQLGKLEKDITPADRRKMALNIDEAHKIAMTHDDSKATEKPLQTIRPSDGKCMMDDFDIIRLYSATPCDIMRLRPHATRPPTIIKLDTPQNFVGWTLTYRQTLQFGDFHKKFYHCPVGFKLGEEVPADGDCLFHAFLEVRNGFGVSNRSEETVRDLKQSLLLFYEEISHRHADRMRESLRRRDSCETIGRALWGDSNDIALLVYLERMRTPNFPQISVWHADTHEWYHPRYDGTDFVDEHCDVANGSNEPDMAMLLHEGHFEPLLVCKEPPVRYPITFRPMKAVSVVVVNDAAPVVGAVVPGSANGSPVEVEGAAAALPVPKTSKSLKKVKKLADYRHKVHTEYWEGFSDTNAPACCLQRGSTGKAVGKFTRRRGKDDSAWKSEYARLETKAVARMKKAKDAAKKRLKDAKEAAKTSKPKSGESPSSAPRTSSHINGVFQHVKQMIGDIRGEKSDDEVRFLVNAHTDKNTAKEELCERLLADAHVRERGYVVLLHNDATGTASIADPDMRKRAKVCVRLPPTYRPVLSARNAHNGSAFVSDVACSLDNADDANDTDAAVTRWFLTIQDAYTFLQQLRRHLHSVGSTGFVLRSICIDGKSGIEGTTYKPNDHSGHLTHAYFATPCNLTTTMQLVGRINGIVSDWKGCVVGYPEEMTRILNYTADYHSAMVDFHREFPGEMFNVDNSKHARWAPAIAAFITEMVEPSNHGACQRGGKNNHISSSSSDEHTNNIARNGKDRSTEFHGVSDIRPDSPDGKPAPPPPPAAWSQATPASGAEHETNRKAFLRCVKNPADGIHTHSSYTNVVGKIASRKFTFRKRRDHGMATYYIALSIPTNNLALASVEQTQDQLRTWRHETQIQFEAQGGTKFTQNTEQSTVFEALDKGRCQRS